MPIPMDVLRQLVDQGLSGRRICAELKCSEGSVRHWLTRYGIKLMRGPHGRLPPPAVPEGVIEQPRLLPGWQPPKLQRTPDEKGVLAEAAFEYMALLYGYTVLRPSNPQLKYDRVVECKGRWTKVQVKSAWTCGTGYFIDLRSGKYAEGDFDVLAVYHPEERDFWFFPADVAVARHGVLCRTIPVARTNGFDSSKFWRRWGIFGA